MSDLFSEFLSRPLAAFTAGIEALAGAGSVAQRAEAALARAAHTLSAAPGSESAAGTVGAGEWRPDPPNALPTAQQTSVNDPDSLVIPVAEEYLARGVALLRWWEGVERQGGPKQQFQLARSFNPPNRSFGFFDVATFEGRSLPVMGNVQEMFYDQPRAPASVATQAIEWLWGQLREFVLRYFMRVSSFRQPEAFSDAAQPLPPPGMQTISWCTQPQDTRQGFGFTQLYGRLHETGQPYVFPSYERDAIVDLRQIGRKYKWLVLKVRIFDFSVRTRPLGEDGPEMVFALDEQSYLVMNDQFVINRERPKSGVLGEYGFGYAFIKNPKQSVIGYGPGEFDAAFESIRFSISEDGRITVRMVFVANQPTQLARIPIDPLDWGLRLANAASLGLASWFIQPARNVLACLPLRIYLDPINEYIDAAGFVSGGSAARQLCISSQQLNRMFLLQHFMQHYRTIIGSLLTWRQIPDWLDEKNLPPWVMSGRAL
jgi:hypothetical protein